MWEAQGSGKPGMCVYTLCLVTRVHLLLDSHVLATYVTTLGWMHTQGAAMERHNKGAGFREVGYVCLHFVLGNPRAPSTG